MRSSIVLSFAVLLTAVSLRAAETPAAPPAQPGPPAQHHYVVVLKPGKGADPDVAAFGGTVQFSQYGRMFVTIPDNAVDALRKHARVKYLQKTVLPSEVTPSAAPPTTASANLRAGINAAQRLTPAPAGTGSWSTGTYTYDGAGNVSAVGTAAAPNSDGRTNTYNYDVLGRLATGTANFAGGNVSQTFSYDPYGNMIEVDTTDPTGTYYNPISVAAGSNRLNGANVTYDAGGNLTGDGTSSARFDSANMMTWKTASGVQEFYLYDAADQRVGVQSGNAFWTWSFRDEAGNVLRQYQSIATLPQADWLWLEDYAYRDRHLLTAERVTEEGGRREFHLDHLGTPRLVTGTNGGLIARHDYLPFGKEITSIRQELDEGFDRIDPAHFTGHERDFTTVQSYSSDYTDYLHARYYDTMMARFFSVDPVLGSSGDPQSWNRYSYVRNNPMTSVDPTGMVENGKPCNTDGIGTPCMPPAPQFDPSLIEITVTAKAPPTMWQRVKGFFSRVVHPDYVAGSAGGITPWFVGGGGGGAISRSGNAFKGWWVGAGTPGPNASATMGWILGAKRTEAQVDNFIVAKGATAGGTIWGPFGANVTWGGPDANGNYLPGNGFAVEVGIMAPGYSAAYTHMYDAGYAHELLKLPEATSTREVSPRSTCGRDWCGDARGQ